jgi:hypothetical protein
MPLQELAALRNVSSTSRFRPAEEQFIEQNPWANPQHPANAHLIHRQSSAQNVQRTTSPFSHVQNRPRRHSQHGSGGPISGTFSNSSSLLQHTNGPSMSGGRISPHNLFANINHSHTNAPSPLGSRQASLSPQLSRPSQVLSVGQHGQPNTHETKSSGSQLSPSATITGLHTLPRDCQQEVRQASVLMGRF